MASNSTKKSKKGVRSKAFHIASEVNSAIGGPVLTLANDPQFRIVKIPSGSLAIDRILGGGFALGRHIEIYGNESACKTTICYRTMALSQARGNVCALIDPERTFDPAWFKHLGGIAEELIIWPVQEEEDDSPPPNAEEAIEVMMLLMRKNLEVITIDSVAALATREEMSKAPNSEKDVRIASQARFMSTNLRRLTTVNKSTLCLWTNQNRTKIGSFFGNPTTQPGGRALKFYDTARIEVVRGESITSKGKKVNSKNKIVDSTVKKGYWVMARAHKNKAGREGQEASFVFDIQRGQIDRISEIIQLGLIDGLITRTERTFSYVDYDEEEWSGTEAQFRKMLTENKRIQRELIECIEDQTVEIAYPSSDDEEEDDDDE